MAKAQVSELGVQTRGKIDQEVLDSSRETIELHQKTQLLTKQIKTIKLHLIIRHHRAIRPLRSMAISSMVILCGKGQILLANLHFLQQCITHPITRKAHS